MFFCYINSRKTSMVIGRLAGIQFRFLNWCKCPTWPEYGGRMWMSARDWKRMNLALGNVANLQSRNPQLNSKGKKDLTLNCVSHQMLKIILLVSEIRIFKAGVLSALPNPSSEKTPNLGLFCIQFPKLGGEFTEFAGAVIKNPATNLTQKLSNIAVPRWQRNILKCI